VYSVVSSEVSLLSESLVTHNTSVRSFSGVRSSVNRQQRLVLKTLATFLARVLLPTDSRHRPILCTCIHRAASVSVEYSSKLSVFVQENFLEKKTVGGRPPRYAPAPLLPLWAKRFAPPSTPQRRSTFPRPIRSHAHRWGCLTR